MQTVNLPEVCLPPATWTEADSEPKPMFDCPASAFGIVSACFCQNCAQPISLQPADVGNGAVAMNFHPSLAQR